MNKWDEYRGIIKTTKGGWKIGNGISIHGHSLLDELVPNCSWFQIWILSVTGKLPERRLADWTETVWSCLSYPDPRIWCNQVAALAGTSRCSPVSATSAAVMTSDAMLYASWAAKHAAKFFEDTLPLWTSGKTIEEILSSRPMNSKGCPIVPGFSRPVANGDERIPLVEKQTLRFGFEKGICLQYAYTIHHYLKQNFNEEINGGGYVPAFLLDQGMTPEDIYNFYSMGVQAGAMSCFIDAKLRPPEAFLPMKCDDIEYVGINFRTYPHSK